MMTSATCHLLKNAHEQVQPNLVVALSQYAITVIALLRDLHNHISLQRLKMQMEKEPSDQPSQKLSVCPFCQYSGSNDQSYLNHIMCVHYCANYRCRKCLDAVFTSRQQLSRHMKKCKGLTTDRVKGKPSPSHVKGMSPLSSKKKKHKKKKSHGNSQSDSQKNLQGDSLMNSQQDSQLNSQASPHQSMHQAKKESATATPQKKSHSWVPASTRAKMLKQQDLKWEGQGQQEVEQVPQAQVTLHLLAPGVYAPPIFSILITLFS